MSTANTTSPSFGQGGFEPYGRALRGEGGSTMHLDSGEPGHPVAHAIAFDRFVGPADSADVAILRLLRGPLLDIGCGPGRMLDAARRHGIAAAGVDVSEEAVLRARSSGSRVLQRSVFEPLPWTGAWASLLLLDGNIGIGGDPDALLERCRELLRPGGVVAVETHPDRDRLRCFECSLVDREGLRSARFPWAEVGANALVAIAARHGLALSLSAETRDREFLFLTRIR